MKETEALIETSVGNIRIKLYNETPQHRDNFIKLAKDGAYDNILFHRVVRNFMIQTGDPSIKPQGELVKVDTSRLNYTIPAEIVYPKYFHKKGALAAARMGDDVNPQKASSSSQFYIVTGRKYSVSSLMELYSALYQGKVNQKMEELARSHMKEIFMLRRRGETERLESLQDSLLHEAETFIAQNPPLPYNDIQKKAYTTEGGAAHLDGEYTVFGEVTEGIEVAEKIETVRTIKERPTQEIIIKKIRIIE